MTGKLKTKGNMMFATKLDGVLKASTSHFPFVTSTHTYSAQCTGGEDESQALNTSAVSMRCISLYPCCLLPGRKTNV